MDDRSGDRHDEPTPTIVREDYAGGAAPRDEEESDDGEFEFPFVSQDDAAPADELFTGGRIRAFYPVFGRVLNNVALEPAEPARAPLGRLFQLEKARTSSVASSSSSSSASTDDLDSASPDSYCLWAPGSSSPTSSPSRRPPRKSGSTGSSSMPRWRRIGDLVVGRSHSDGRDKFLFLSAPPSPARNHASPGPNAKKQQARGGSKAADVNGRMSYGGGAGATGGSPGARLTFLPYRQDLVGLFANVHGLRRSHLRHPF